MDGLVPGQPWSFRANRLKVPYLSASTYRPHGTFYDFPGYHGLASTVSAATVCQRFDDVASMTSFMQSWLFFELLSAFLDFPVDPSDFVSEGFVDLDREAVHAHFRRWKERLWRLPYSQKCATQKHLEGLTSFAMSRSDVFEEAAELSGGNEDFDRVALSIKLLLSLLRIILEDSFSMSSSAWTPMARAIYRMTGGFFWGVAFKPAIDLTGSLFSTRSMVAESRELERSRVQQQLFLPLPPGDRHGGRATTRLIRHLVDNGWCPFRARQLCHNYDYLTVNSLAGIARPIAAPENHQSCIQRGRCSAHDLDVEPNTAYPFRHDCEGNCRFVAINYDRLADIIRSGGIPIISVTFDGTLDVRVERCTPHTTYTAISHVWSDGLGNPNANALPVCQLKRILQLIVKALSEECSPFHDPRDPKRSLAEWTSFQRHRARPDISVDKDRICFWMDTLCIPVCPESLETDETKELRFRAIKQITPIFAGAFHALVLDSGLQETQANDVNTRLLCGDEFSSLVIGSKWMERGWTLEEGCLAQSCVFQMLGKPYEMNMAKNNLMPEVKNYHDPLERAFIQVRRSPVELLNKLLFDSKKHVVMESLSSRAAGLSKLLRVPQFISTWNALINRTTTKPEDGILIIANLLDFNIYALRLIPKSERLMAIIQSCNELPLSLLYNTGPRLTDNHRKGLGWIPRDVLGDSLVVGGIMRKLKSNQADHDVRYVIERPEDPKRERFVVLATLPGQIIPRDTAIFAVSVGDTRGQIQANTSCEYIIEMQAATPLGATQDAIQDEDARKGTCIFVDLACGTRRRRGFTGKGVRLYIDAQDRRCIYLKYDAPLIAWTPEQWRHRTTQPLGSVPSLTPNNRFDMTPVPHKQRLMLSYEARQWKGTLSRRPMFTQHPPQATIPAAVVCLLVLIAIMLGMDRLFVTVRNALGFDKWPSPAVPVAIKVFTPFVSLLIYSPIRRRLAMYSYVSWLKTFEEPRMEPQEGRWSAHALLFLRGLTQRFRRKTGRGVTQFTINVPLRGLSTAARDDRLPGAINLE